MEKTTVPRTLRQHGANPKIQVYLTLKLLLWASDLKEKSSQKLKWRRGTHRNVSFVSG